VQKQILIMAVKAAWAETGAAVSVAVEEDPWGGAEAAAEKDSSDQDGWANFCAFASPSQEAAEGDFTWLRVKT